jgi:murein L,D-transpeptidase YcbB/YkuD
MLIHRIYRNLVFFILISFVSCVNKKSDSFFTAADLNQFILHHKYLKSESENLKSFYNNRNYSYAWIDFNKPNDYAENFLSRYEEDSKTDSVQNQIYLKHLNAINEIISKKHSRIKSDSLKKEFDFTLTAAFFDFAKRNWYGISDKNLKESKWFITRKKINYPLLLDSLLNLNSDVIGSFEPNNNQYYLLKNFLKKYQTFSELGAVCESCNNLTLKKGDHHKMIPSVKNLLFHFGDYENENQDNYFDESLEKAVLRFQHRYGLEENGLIDSETLSAMNVPVADRITQIKINMERARWLPEKIEGDHLFINIPGFKMYVNHDEKTEWACNVVVGNDSNNTVVFSDSLEYIVFSPYWVLPKSIIIKETIPAIIKNPQYLEEHQMEVVNEAGEILDRSQISWQDLGENFPYTIRQKPGKDNSLGYVKFVFPNSHNIYLHDTPARDLFGETNRAFSHGCIRVAEPLKLALYLLRNDPKYTAESIQSLMYGGKETTVRLKNKVPVFITYFTAFADEKGQINFREDIYHHDEILKKILFQ